MVDLAHIRHLVHDAKWSTARAAASGDGVALEYVRAHARRAGVVECGAGSARREQPMRGTGDGDGAVGGGDGGREGAPCNIAGWETALGSGGDGFGGGDWREMDPDDTGPCCDNYLVWDGDGGPDAPVPF